MAVVSMDDTGVNSDLSRVEYIFLSTKEPYEALVSESSIERYKDIDPHEEETIQSNAEAREVAI